MAGLAYLESSAIVKLVALEAETSALEADLANRDGLLTSRLAATEISRAARRSKNKRILQQADDVLESFVIVEVTTSILAAAGSLDPAGLRTLDAIHLATAASLGMNEVDFICYDDRLAAAARTLGLTVVRPGSV
jgi:predicted nucleic acid-binding protein